MQRVRIHYRKGEELQYIGNLDLHRIWERTFRRAQIKLAYSQGFHPQPRMHQACPLPLGFTSQVELLDFWCDSEDSLAELQKKLVKTVQPGIEIVELSTVPLKNPPLQTIVESVVYNVYLDQSNDLDEISNKIEKLNKADHCMRERRGKPYDLRSLLLKLSLDQSIEPAVISMQLSALPGATGRPEEVLDELGISPFSVDVIRTNMVLITSP